MVVAFAASFACGEAATLQRTSDASTAPAVDAGGSEDIADAAMNPKEAEAEEPRSLFDGRSLAGWSTYLGVPNEGGAPLGSNHDPRQVFTVRDVDGEPAIAVSGEVWGVLVSDDEYADFELTLEYKWGTRLWPPLSIRDSGIMVLSTGALGAVNAGGDALSDPPGSGSFMVSVEYQLAPGDVGGLYNLGPIEKTMGTRTPRPERDGWNRATIVVRGNTSEHWLNDERVASASGYRLAMPGETPRELTRGKIQLQSEGAEIFFRHVTIRSLAGT